MRNPITMPSATRLVLVIIVTLCIAGPFTLALPQQAFAAGTTYYVDSVAGNDSANGQSTSTAWQSLSKVNGTTFQPGDQILFKAGDSWTGQLHPLGSGNSSNTITINQYGSGNKPKIDGAGGVADAVYLYNQQYWDINNLEVTNDSTTASARTGVHVIEQDLAVANHIHISNLFIHNIKGYVNGYYAQSAGISIQSNSSSSAPTTHWNDVLIQNNTITTVDRLGILVGPNVDGATVGKSTNVVIQYNTISDAGGDAVLTYQTSHDLVQYNVAHDNGARASQSCQSSTYCNQYSVDFWTVYTDYSVFQYNEAYNDKSNHDGEGFDVDWGAVSPTFQYNYSHNNRGGFILDCRYCGSPSGTNPTFRYNISVNDGGGHDFVGDDSGKVSSYNNVIYRDAGTGATFGTIGGENNIYYEGKSSTDNVSCSGTCDYNDVFHVAPSSGNSHGTSANPLFANPGTAGVGITTLSGFQLQNTSPLIGVGTVIANNGGQDFFGNAVSATSAPNIGAYNGPGVASTIRNLLSNPGFEMGSLGAWTQYGGASVVASNARSGSYAGQTAASNTALEQVVTGLTAGTTYVLIGWAKVANAGEGVYIGVKDFGGAETNSFLTSTSYTQSIFTFTTGASNTSAKIYCYKASGAGVAYCDDFILVSAATNLAANAGFETGALSPWYVSSNTSTVVASNAHSGTYALQTSSSYSGANQTISGLSPNTTYVLAGWLKVTTSGDSLYIGVKDFGGAETSNPITSTSYIQDGVTFTTGVSNTTATIYIYKLGGSAVAYGDDVVLTALP